MLASRQNEGAIVRNVAGQEEVDEARERSQLATGREAETGRTRTDYGGCCVCKESHCPRAVFNPNDIAVISKIVGHLQRTIWF